MFHGILSASQAPPHQTRYNAPDRAALQYVLCVAGPGRLCRSCAPLVYVIAKEKNLVQQYRQFNG